MFILVAKQCGVHSTLVKDSDICCRDYTFKPYFLMNGHFNTCTIPYIVFTIKCVLYNCMKF